MYLYQLASFAILATAVLGAAAPGKKSVVENSKVPHNPVAHVKPPQAKPANQPPVKQSTSPVAKAVASPNVPQVINYEGPKHFSREWQVVEIDYPRPGDKVNVIYNCTDAAYFRFVEMSCPGDVYHFYNNGTLIGEAKPSECNNCTRDAHNPEVAYQSENYSHFSAPISEGLNVITIELKRVASNCSKKAMFAARFDRSPVKCCLSLSGLTLINTPMPYTSAHFACQQFGLKLADIDIFNFDDATKVAFGCAGANKSAWVKGAFGNAGECLALYTGTSAPGGSISRPLDCFKPLPVLCQGETRSCFKHFLRA